MSHPLHAHVSLLSYTAWAWYSLQFSKSGSNADQRKEPCRLQRCHASCTGRDDRLSKVFVLNISTCETPCACQHSICLQLSYWAPHGELFAETIVNHFTFRINSHGGTLLDYMQATLVRPCWTWKRYPLQTRHPLGMWHYPILASQVNIFQYA